MTDVHEGRDGKGGEEKEREGKEKEGKGREGKRLGDSGVQKWRKRISALETAWCNSFHWQNFKEEEEGDNPPQH